MQKKKNYLILIFFWGESNELQLFDCNDIPRI